MWQCRLAPVGRTWTVNAGYFIPSNLWFTKCRRILWVLPLLILPCYFLGVAQQLEAKKRHILHTLSPPVRAAHSKSLRPIRAALTFSTDWCLTLTLHCRTCLSRATVRSSCHGWAAGRRRSTAGTVSLYYFKDILADLREITAMAELLSIQG